LVQQKELLIPDEDYGLSRFREDMRLFEGVLLPSKNLVGYFKEQLLHTNVVYFPIAIWQQSQLRPDYLETRRKDEIVFAFTGGSHRKNGLWDIVVPALVRLAQDGIKIHLLAPEQSGN